MRSEQEILEAFLLFEVARDRGLSPPEDWFAAMHAMLDWVLGSRKWTGPGNPVDGTLGEIRKAVAGTDPSRN